LLIVAPPEGATSDVRAGRRPPPGGRRWDPRVGARIAVLSQRSNHEPLEEGLDKEER
jgi:hypothetical protein